MLREFFFAFASLLDARNRQIHRCGRAEKERLARAVKHDAASEDRTSVLVFAPVFSKKKNQEAMGWR